ncbi:MAG TPA: phosphate ABC transporter substrate-binding protein [Alphaproteobacteria bacterium]
MTSSVAPLRLHTLLADYPNTLALKKGEVRSPLVNFDFADIKIANQGFKPLVRESKFDAGELAIVTYLQAKQYGKPYALLPAVVMGRGQHHTIAYNAERGTLRPADLPGRRVGVRAYSQTTGVWLRGILQNDYGVDIGRVTWVTVEDPHLAEYRDPPNVDRQPAGKVMLDMLLAGEIDAAIVGDKLPDDKRVKYLIPDPQAAAQAWADKHGFSPVNHFFVVREAIAKERPDVVKEIFRLLALSKTAAGGTAKPDPLPMGINAVRDALTLIVEYAVQQRLIPRRFSIDELFDPAMRALGA